MAGLCLAVVFNVAVELRAREPLDTMVFGDDISDSTHALVSERSEGMPSGALGETARRLLPPLPKSWGGGVVTFKLKVDPALPNYFTARFLGADTHPNRLILFCEGKQVGYRHLGDIDLLDIGNKDAGYNGRFFYNTSPLPIGLTRGKSEVTFQIRATGPIWGYGGTFEAYQKPVTEPTRGVYRVYTHTDGAFTPPADEIQGEYPGDWKSAHTGEELPIARVPAGVQFKPGDENIHAGKAQLYTLRYGDYLIGLNTTTDRTFDLTPPAGVAQASELVSGKVVPLDAPLKIGPRSTVVLYLGK